MSDRLAYTLQQAAEQIGMSESFVKREIRAARLKAKKAGVKTLVTRTALEEWLEDRDDAEIAPPTS